MRRHLSFLAAVLLGLSSVLAWPTLSRAQNDTAQATFVVG